MRAPCYAAVLWVVAAAASAHPGHDGGVYCDEGWVMEWDAPCFCGMALVDEGDAPCDCWVDFDTCHQPVVADAGSAAGDAGPEDDAGEPPDAGEPLDGGGFDASALDASEVAQEETARDVVPAQPVVVDAGLTEVGPGPSVHTRPWRPSSEPQGCASVGASALWAALFLLALSPLLARRNGAGRRAHP